MVKYTVSNDILDLVIVSALLQIHSSSISVMFQFVVIIAHKMLNILMSTAGNRALQFKFKVEGYSKPHLTMSELTFTLVGVCVREARCLSGLASEQSPEVGAHLVLAPLLDCVALSTLLDKSFLSLGNISHSQLEKHKVKANRTDREREKSEVAYSYAKL